jgi:protein required for attachment to host cells
MPTTWIVAADSSRARILEQGRDKHLQEIEDLVNPEGRAQGRELNSDAHGRFNAYGNRSRHHTAGATQDPVQHDVELFSKELARFLEKARTEHRYDSLCLVAPPKFLGLLRQDLSKEAQKLVAREIDEDLAWFEPPELENHLLRHFQR